MSKFFLKQINHLNIIGKNYKSTLLDEIKCRFAQMWSVLQIYRMREEKKFEDFLIPSACYIN